MNILILVLYFFTNCFCFGLTSIFKEDRLLLEKGRHFNFVFPDGVGTLIHPQWCLTTIRAQPSIGTTFNIDNEKFCVETVIPHPLYFVTPGLSKFKYDLALVKINKPILTRPFIERERDDTSSSSVNWIVSTKDRVLKAGLIDHSGSQKNLPYYDTSYNDFTRLVYRDVIYPDSSYFSENSLKNLAVEVENSDNASPTFSFPFEKYGQSLSPVNELKLTGITMGTKKTVLLESYIKSYDPNFQKRTREAAIILRLPKTGLNEFIDMIQLKDALGENLNALVNKFSYENILQRIKH